MLLSGDQFLSGITGVLVLLVFLSAKLGRHDDAGARQAVNRSGGRTVRPARVTVGAGDEVGAVVAGEAGAGEAGAGAGVVVGDKSGEVDGAAGGKTHCDAAGGGGEVVLEEALGGADMTGGR